MIPPLRPNYLISDFRPGQMVILRCDGQYGVPKYLDGDQAVVLKATTSRVVVRMGAGDRAELRVKPNQIAQIVNESARR